MKSSIERRRALELLGGAAGLAALGCGGESSPTAASTVTTAPAAGTGSATSGCAVTAEETAGPYPDKTGMINNAAFFRRDITEGRNGVPLTLNLMFVNSRNGCAAQAKANVEIWQCDAAGQYSEYAQPGYDGTGKTFLRGVQTTDDGGRVTFKTIYPGWYMGRATHIHVQVFVNGSVVKTTQVAFPESVTAEVYASSVYASKGKNPTSNASDNVFSDGTQTEMATVAGDPASGYSADLTVTISA